MALLLPGTQEEATSSTSSDSWSCESIRFRSAAGCESFTRRRFSSSYVQLHFTTEQKKNKIKDASGSVGKESNPVAVLCFMLASAKCCRAIWPFLTKNMSPEFVSQLLCPSSQASLSSQRRVSSCKQSRGNFYGRAAACVWFSLFGLRVFLFNGSGGNDDSGGTCHDRWHLKKSRKKC